jgi:protochlorophyllide reductase
VTEERTKKSGTYWSWNGNAKQVGVLKDGVVVGAGGSGGDLFENEQSELVRDPVRAEKMFDLR